MATLEQILTLLTPVILAVVGLVAARVEARIKAVTHVEMESYHRDALHKALTTGVRLAIAKIVRDSQSVDAHVDEIKSQAVAYARRSVPDAIAYLSAHLDAMLDIAESKIDEAAPPIFTDLVDAGDTGQGQLAL